MRAINRVIIHYSDTYPGMDIGVVEIRRWHTDPNKLGGPYRDIGYHHVIRRNGQIEIGRPVGQVGAHAGPEGNPGSIGVCVVGGKPIMNFTRAQWRMLDFYCVLMLQKYGDLEIIGHRDVRQTLCPGFNVKAWWND